MKIVIVRRGVQRIRELDRHFVIIMPPLRIYRVKSMMDYREGGDISVSGNIVFFEYQKEPSPQA